MSIDEGRVTKKELISFIEDAGRYEGLGDGRTMGFGRFTVKTKD